MNTLRRIFATALLLPALALAQTQEDRATLYSEIATNLAAGQSGGITAAQLRQVCNDTVASTSNLSDSNASVSLTYTGTPITPLAIHVFPQAIYAATAGTGSPVTFTQSTESSFIGGFDYEEGAAAPAGVGLSSLSFNDLVSGGNIYVANCPNLLTLSFPALKDAQEFHFSQIPLLTTLSLPNLVQTVLSESAIGGSGDFFISGTSLTTLSLPAMTTIGGGITQENGGLALQSMPLTTLSMPVLSTVNGLFEITSMASLPSLSFPDLVNVTGLFNVTTFASLTSFSFPVLANVGGNFTPVTMGILTSLSLPDLAYVGGNFAPATMASLTTWSFPALVTIGGTFAPATMGALTDLECNALQTVGGAFSITSMASLTTVSFSGMVTYGSTIDLHTSNGKIANLTLGTIGTLKAITGATINVSGQALTSASVNAVLALLVSLDGTNGTTLWGSGKTLTINGGTNGAPTGQGITDKATLVARGATITTN